MNRLPAVVLSGLLHLVLLVTVSVWARPDQIPKPLYYLAIVATFISGGVFGINAWDLLKEHLFDTPEKTRIRAQRIAEIMFYAGLLAAAVLGAFGYFWISLILFSFSGLLGFAMLRGRRS